LGEKVLTNFVETLSRPRAVIPERVLEMTARIPWWPTLEHPVIWKCFKLTRLGARHSRTASVTRGDVYLRQE
jgi:hypothetical protein